MTYHFLFSQFSSKRWRLCRISFTLHLPLTWDLLWQQDLGHLTVVDNALNSLLRTESCNAIAQLCGGKKKYCRIRIQFTYFALTHYQTNAFNNVIQLLEAQCAIHYTIELDCDIIFNSTQTLASRKNPVETFEGISSYILTLLLIFMEVEVSLWGR